MSLLVSDIAFCKFSTKTYNESLGAEEHIISSARSIETAVSCHLLLGNGFGPKPLPELLPLKN